MLKFVVKKFLAEHREAELEGKRIVSATHQVLVDRIGDTVNVRTQFETLKGLTQKWS